MGRQPQNLARVDLDPSVVSAHPDSDSTEPPRQQDGLGRLDAGEQPGVDRLAVRDARRETSVRKLLRVPQPAGPRRPPHIRLGPTRVGERMAEPGLIHSSEAGSVVAQVVDMDTVEILSGPPFGAEREEPPGLDGPAKIAAVGRVGPVLRSLQGVHGEHFVPDPDLGGDPHGPLHLGMGDRGPAEGDRDRLGPERLEGEGRDDRGIDPPGEGDHRRPTVGDPADDGPVVRRQ